MYTTARTMPPWTASRILAATLVAAAFASAWLPGAAAGHHEIVVHEEKPVRHPHGLYNYGFLQPGYDYYSLATLIALKLKAVLVVAAIFFGISWWYGLYGVKGGYGGYNGGYSGYGAQSKWSSDHDLPVAFERDDRLPMAPLPPPPLASAPTLPPRVRPRPPVPSADAGAKAPQHRYPAEAARSAPDSETVMDTLIKGLELVDLSFGVFGPRAPGVACRQRLACELRRVAAGRPLLRRALSALGDPPVRDGEGQEPRTRSADCATQFPGCQANWERIPMNDGDRHMDAGS